MDRAPETAREATKAKDALENFLGLGLVIVGVVLLAKYVGGEELRAWVEGAGAWGPIALVVAKASTIVIAPLSGGPLYPLAGALFGAAPAILYLTIGDALGGAIAFAIARRFGRKIVERMLAKANAGFLDKALALMGTARGFFVARVCFAALPEAVSYGAGLTKLRFAVFLPIYVVVGIVPTVILAYVGQAAIEGGGWIAALGLIGGSIAAAAGMALFALMAKRMGKSDSEKAFNDRGRTSEKSGDGE